MTPQETAAGLPYRQRVLLALLGSGKDQCFTLSQLTRAAYVFRRNAKTALDRRPGEPKLLFEAGDYGPTLPGLDADVETLRRATLVEELLRPHSRIWVVKATFTGVDVARGLRATLPPDTADYADRVADFVHALSFTELTASLVQTYPKMLKGGRLPFAA